jgi:hypothetical protein
MPVADEEFGNPAGSGLCGGRVQVGSVGEPGPPMTLAHRFPQIDPGQSQGQGEAVGPVHRDIFRGWVRSWTRRRRGLVRGGGQVQQDEGAPPDHEGAKRVLVGESGP